MKKSMLYAPMLLLALSTACGGKSSEQSSEVKSFNPAVSPEQISRFVPKSVADAITQLDVSNAVRARIERLREFADEVTGTVATPANASAPAANGSSPAVASPAEGAEATPAVGAVPFVTTSLSVGNPVVDGLCKRSFAATEALLFQGNVEAFNAISLKQAENTLCLTQLKNLSKKLITDLRLLGRVFSLPISVKDENGVPVQPQQRLTITAHQDWDKYGTDPEAVQYLFAYVDFYAQDETFNVQPQALEILRLTQLELEEFAAIDPALMDAEKVERLVALQAKLPGVQAEATETQSRLNKYNALYPAAELGFYVSLLEKELANPTLLTQPAPTEPAPGEPVAGEGQPVPAPAQPAPAEPEAPAQPAAPTPV